MIGILALLAAIAGPPSPPELVVDSVPEPEKPAIVSPAEHKTFAVLTSPVWRRRPTSEEISAVFPGRGENGAHNYSATLHCFLGYGGELKGCYASNQYPYRSAFGAAILKLTFMYKAWLANPAGTSGQIVEFEEFFDPKTLAPSKSSPPGWDRVPSIDEINAAFPERAGRLMKKGEAKARCFVRADGRLDACRIVAESKPDFGYGDALVMLTPLYRANPGLSLGADRTVEVHETFDFNLMPRRDEKVLVMPATAPPRP